MDNIFTGTSDHSLSALDAVFGNTASTVETPSKVFDNPTIDKALDAEPVTQQEEAALVVTNTGELNSVLDAVNNEITIAEETTETPAETQTGRPKVEKSTLVSYLAPKIESQEFGIPENAAYDPAKQSITDYLSGLSEKDQHNLLESNWKAREEELRAQAPQEFYEALPDPVKIVAEYAAKGGNDWDGLFNSLISARQVEQLDPNNDEHHAPIVQTYLQETTQMTPQQISEQIEDWKESGKLEKKAQEFKVPLDSIQKQRTDVFNKQAEENKRQEQEIANFFAENVSTTLGRNELAGIKLDKKFSAELQNGLVSVGPGPFSGKPVNLLGHIIEQHQFVKPDYESIALMTWMGLDKEGCIKAIQSLGANHATQEAVKLIKLGQGINSGGEAPANRQDVKPVKRLPNTSNVLKRKTA
jgi:hypothetical protein